jgi:DNA-directed RNA polymerase sigma subunit (sigma70/sigma32)
MAAQARGEDRGDRNGYDPTDDDDAAVRDLIRRSHLDRPLQPGEEARLLEQSALGDRASQERLVAVHLATVVRLAASRANRGLSVGDLVQEGSIGLVEAVRSFVGSGHTDFSRFAELKIAAQMDAAIAAEAAATRDAELLVAACTDYERTEAAMRWELHREPTAKELAEKLEWTLERTRYISRVVADARRRHDEELLAFVDPEMIDFDDEKLTRLDG